MKVAFFTSCFPNLSQTFILNQIMGLIDRGHDLEIYALKMGEVKIEHSYVDQYRLIDRTRYLLESLPNNPLLRISGAFVRIIRNYKDFHHLLKTLNFLRYGHEAWSLRLLYSAAYLLEQKPCHYDVLHCQFGPLGLKVLPLKQIGVITGKLITSFRGYDATKYVLKGAGIYNQLFREGDLFIPVSETLKRWLINEGCDPIKVHVLHSGIDCTMFKYAARKRDHSKPIKLITIARLVEKKGVKYAIEAVAKLIASGQNIEYSVIGDGIERNTLQKLIKDLGVEDKIHLLGWKSHDEVVNELHDAHVLVAPSVTAIDGDQEGIPNVIKEAMAMGIPVLATYHGGIPELVDNGVSGFLAPERNVDALADRLTDLLSHPERWTAMGRSGRLKVEAEFDITKLNEELIAIYTRVTETR